MLEDLVYADFHRIPSLVRKIIMNQITISISQIISSISQIIISISQIKSRSQIQCLLVLGLKEGLVECATVCVKSWVMLIKVSVSF